MNKERVKAVRDLIASLPPERVRMDWFAVVIKKDGEIGDDVSPAVLNTECGTVGCIAGWTCALIAQDSPLPSPNDNYCKLAAEWLGLDYNLQGRALFMPEGWTAPGLYPPSAVLATLDHLLEAGEVKWPAKTGAAQ